VLPYANVDKSTVIFAGIDEALLERFDRLMLLDLNHRPNIIFSEMTTSDKGVLAAHMKTKGYFIVANGDGTNDIAMMKEANFVIAHLSRDGTYAPYVSQYVNINDKQVQKLCHKTSSFYELFDIHRKANSQFILPFINLANAQEMVSYALIFKTIKLSMELARALDYDATEIFQQQWISVVVDLSWLWISEKIILNNANLPVNNQHLMKSWLPLKCMFLTMFTAITESFLCYQLLGKTSDYALLALTITFLPIGLTSFFRGFLDVQNEFKLLDKDEQQILQVTAEKKEAKYPLKKSLRKLSVFSEKKPDHPLDTEVEKKRCCIIL
jgi:hypothetical protein